MLTPGTRIGPYEIREAIGQGGMGEVYRAHDTKLNRDVALKILPEHFAEDPDRLMRFTREAQTLAALNHPNIAQIHGLEGDGSVQPDGKTSLLALVMELVDGEDLSAVIARGAMPPAEALPVAKQIAAALDAAHDHGIVHRDLKPANVKVKADGTVKVLDFGLAKLSAQGRDGTTAAPTMTSPALTAMGVILGTAAYMSPEQARGKPADKRADIWAFGVLLYETLTGRQAFSGETVSDVIAGVLTREIDWAALPDDTPAPVRRLLRRCLERDPKKRLRDIGDAIFELEDGNSLSAAGSGAASGTTPSASGGSRRAALLAAGAALAAAAVTFGVMAWGTAATPVGPMTFSLPAPPDTRLDQVAISPDGRSLVFAAESSSGVSHLWLRQLDGRDVRRLDGTDGGRDPFWSPDSRFLGFFTEAQLLRIEVATGVSESLAAVTNSRGGAWNRDGTIVVGGDGLLRIPAGGGDVTTALATDVEAGENAIRYPSFLPDGEHVLFYSRNAKNRALAGLWIVSLDTGARQQLAAAASSSAVYVEPGYLLYRRDQYLIAHAFDAASRTLTGDPTPIADDVWYEPGVTALTSVSASENRTVTFRSGGAEATDLAWFDRQGRRIGTEWEPKSFVTVALSPDGSKILTGFPGQGIERNAWLYDTPTATARQITSTGDNAGSHVFSDDGARAIIGIITEAKLGMWLARLGSGAAPELLPAEHDPTIPTDWHGTLVIHQGGAGPTRSLYALDLDTGTNRQLVDRPGDEGFGVVSPDGRWLAYSSNETGEWEIYVETFPEAGGRWRVSADGGHQPRWNPKGSELFYIAPDRQLMSAGVRGGSNTFQWDTARPLFQTDIVDLGPYRGSWGYAVAPDGNRFLILTRRPQGPSPAIAILNWR